MAQGAIAVIAVLAALAGWIAWVNLRDDAPGDAARPFATGDAQVQRGAYLARAGNCAGCHRRPGGGAYAGGVGVETPFGTVYAPNLSPDVRTGLGAWTADDFWRAMHHGRSKTGRLLYPAFPYPSYTTLTRDDSDALYAFLRRVAPVAQANLPHALRFPFDTQPALAVWRALYFRPARFVPEPGQGAEWNRGKYLVQTLGHCAACHSARNLLGGTPINAEFDGGLLPDRSWYAPSLADPGQAGVQRWAPGEVVVLLKTGVSAQASVLGPMAGVVFTSTQHLNDADLAAMARYLQSIPVREAEPAQFRPPPAEVVALGSRLYAAQCAACHGDRGEGVPSIYPALAGNRAVALTPASNLIQAIRWGGYPPSTAGNPQPFGMPPFGHLLNENEIAAVATFLRQSWGHRANEVTGVDVLGVR